MSICNFHLLRKTMTDNLPEGEPSLTPVASRSACWFNSWFSSLT